jgi:5-methylcytosine-specific restriction endonuclease McrA
MSNGTLPLFALCSIAECGRLLLAKGLCRKHYSVAWRTGDPLDTCKATYEKSCRVCGKSFTCSSRGQVVCQSPECIHGRDMAAWQKYRAANPRVPVERIEAPCRVCGQPFLSDGRHSSYCSRACFRRATNAAGVVRRKHYMRDIAWEVFTRTEIFIRDGWVCALCGCDIDPKLDHPDVMSASLDHIIPITKGGPHTRENTQASHLRCNISKGNRV